MGINELTEVIARPNIDTACKHFNPQEQVSASKKRLLFECVSQLQNTAFILVAAHDLNAYGKSLSSETQGTEIAGSPVTVI